MSAIAKKHEIQVVVVDKPPEGEDVGLLPFNWKPRHYQLAAWEYFERGGRRGACVWHRRAGKDLFAINLCVCKAVQRVGLYWHIFPTYSQGRKVIWDGFTKDGRAFLDHFPEDLIAKKNDTEMRLELKNGSIYQVVGSDNPDRLVGANPVGVIFSEYSLQDPAVWNLIRPILAENDGWAIFIYTARGRNHGYDLIKMAQKNKTWFHEILVATHTNAIPLSVIDEDRASGMPEELIQQEYFCSFDAPLVGAYYGDQMMKMIDEEHPEKSRIANVQWDPRLMVDTAWDIGVGDSTAIWFIQEYGQEIRIIDYYENCGKGLEHYAKLIHEKDYNYRNHYGPHDLEVREFTQAGKRRIDIARDLGVRFRVVPKHPVDEGINLVRSLLPRVWIDRDRCERGIEALRQYRKEWDDKKKCFRDTPEHDWTSHAADAIRYYAYGCKEKSRHQFSPQRKALTNYNRFSTTMRRN